MDGYHSRFNNGYYRHRAPGGAVAHVRSAADRSHWFFKGVFVCLVATLWPLMLTAQELVINEAVPSTQISQNQARLCFTMRLPLWENNVPVKVFVLPDNHPLHRQFVKNILGLFPYQLRQVWDRQIFSGTGQAPITVATEQEMVEQVASTPGGIGYVKSGSSYPHVRMLEVR